MNYRIRERQAEEPIPYNLLLLADPDRLQIDAYLSYCQVYLLELDGTIAGVGVLRINDTEGEIMNIAVASEYQRKGLGRALLQGLAEAAKQHSVRRLLIATGNSSIGQIALYQQLGFELTGINWNHFLNNYPDPIWENGIRCRHQLVFEKLLEP